MNTELKNAVMATDRDAQYDNSAKRLIAHKIILARILVKTVEEFKGMDPLEVAALIEGLPYISCRAGGTGTDECGAFSEWSTPCWF